MITFADAKSHLRVDHNAEDADITLKLKLAVALVQNYIGAASDSAIITAEEIIDAAALLVLGELYANRESGADPLSPSVRTILERLRVPGIA